MYSGATHPVAKRHAGYRITFGRSDKSAVKGITHLSRNHALRLANYLGFILFYIHPFRNSETKGYAKYEANGFFVEFEELGTDNIERHSVPTITSATLAVKTRLPKLLEDLDVTS